MPSHCSPLGAAGAHAATYPAGFEGRTLVSGLNQPTAVAYAPDGRMFIAEKAGRLKVVAPGGSTATQLLDIGSRVNGYADRGLLGLAVDSSFATNGYVYLLYTYELNPLIPDSDAPMVSRLTRIQIAANGTVVNPANPETVLLGSYTAGPCPQASNTLDCMASDGVSHSIGTVRSAPDGTLYVGNGDSSSFAVVDQLAYRTYDEQSMSGKILHVDRNGNGLPGHSFCPANANLTHVCTKLYAKGLRNPFRFSIRPDGAGLAVGDVGWNVWEELDLATQAGRNHGWPCYEASTRTPGYRDSSECQAEYAKEGTPSAAVNPDYEYQHTVGSAIIGGPTYTGTSYPAEYRGNIFVGDYTGGFIKRVTLGADGRVNGVQDFASGWFGVDLEQDPSGNLVSVDIVNGAIERIAYTGGASAPIARINASPTAGDAPLNVSFDAGDSTDPDGDPLTYSWSFGDGGTASGQTASHVYASAGTYTATLTARDPGGRTDTATVKIQPGSHAPNVTIAAPADESGYRDGDVVAAQRLGDRRRGRHAAGLGAAVARAAASLDAHPPDHRHRRRRADELRRPARPRRRLVLRHHPDRDRRGRPGDHEDDRDPAADGAADARQRSRRRPAQLRRPRLHRPVDRDHHDRLRHDRHGGQPLHGRLARLRLRRLVRRRRPLAHRARARHAPRRCAPTTSRTTPGTARRAPPAPRASASTPPRRSTPTRPRAGARSPATTSGGRSTSAPRARSAASSSTGRPPTPRRTASSPPPTAPTSRRPRRRRPRAPAPR